MSAHQLRIGVAEAPKQLDREMLATGGFDQVNVEIHAQCYVPLIGYERGPGGETTFHGELAEWWQESDDGRTWTFGLKQDLFSHAGHPLSSEDVRWAWEKAFALDSVGRWMARMICLESPDDVQVLDRLTVRFRLARPSPCMLHVLALQTPTIVDSTEARSHVTADDAWACGWLSDHEAGFGPYRLAAIEDSGACLEATESFLRALPEITELTYRASASVQERIDWLVKGEVDLLPRFPWRFASAIVSRERLRIASMNGHSHISLQMTVRPPLDRPELRQAIALALPYDAVTGVFKGAANRWKGMLDPYCLGYAGELFPFNTDLAAGRAALHSAGLPLSRPLTLTVPDVPDMVEIGSLIADSLAGAGIEINTRRAAGPEIWALAKAGELELLLDGCGHMSPDPLYALCHDYGAGDMGITNHVRYVNARLETLLNEAFGSRDAGARSRLYLEAQQLLAAQPARCPLALPPTMVAMTKDVSGYRFAPNRPLWYAEMSNA